MQEPLFELFVPGVPAPGGSKTHYGKGRTVDACKRNPDWKARVADFACHRWCEAPLDGPLSLKLDFYLPRPKSHFGLGKNSDRLKPLAPLHHTFKPDATKLLRAVEDALTGVVWRDDALIVLQVVTKRYRETPGVLIAVGRME